jgi:putative membrane protein
MLPLVPTYETRLRRALFFATLVGTAVSYVGCFDPFTWLLEVAPVIAGLILGAATARRFPLTPILCVALVAHAAILVVGGHWTYARVPLGEWAKDAFGFSRNHFDRLGHLAQGFVPSMLAREVIARTSPLRGGGWLTTLSIAVALSVSLLYELVEWAAALLSEEAAEAFLGVQGDFFDAQADMFCALIGALLAQLLLRRAHDRAIARVGQKA